jgi:hypothetical protein
VAAGRQYVPGRAAGITGVIEGLLLIALIATGGTGAMWFLLQGFSRGDGLARRARLLRARIDRPVASRT